MTSPTVTLLDGTYERLEVKRSEDWTSIKSFWSPKQEVLLNYRQVRALNSHLLTAPSFKDQVALLHNAKVLIRAPRVEIHVANEDFEYDTISLTHEQLAELRRLLIRGTLADFIDTGVLND